LLVNSSGSAHARNARRIVHAARQQDRRLSAALLAASLAHTPEAQQALDGARTRMARKPAALARELLRNFPKGRRGTKRRRRKGSDSSGAAGDRQATSARSTGGSEGKEPELDLELELEDPGDEDDELSVDEDVPAGRDAA